MKKSVKQNKIRLQRKNRNRAKIFGTAEKPRLSVFRSNRFIAAQLIDDASGKTLLSGTTKEFSKKAKTKVEQAKLLGESIAEKAKKQGIQKVIFNKGAYLYHGRVKAVAEGARAKGLML